MAGLADIHGSLLHMDLEDFRRLARFFEQYPREAQHASAQLLNDLAFAGRPVIPAVLATRIIIRNRRFAESRTRVQKSGSGPIPTQAAILGTIYTAGAKGVSHDGWASLHRGSRPTRDRVLALASRGGQRTAQARRSARLLPSADFPSPDDADDIPYPTPGRRLQYLVREMERYGETTLVVPRRKGYPITPGLYRRTRTRYTLPRSGRRAPKLQLLQRFGKAPRHERWPWMREVVIELRRRVDLGAMWRSACDRVWARMHPPTS